MNSKAAVFFFSFFFLFTHISYSQSAGKTGNWTMFFGQVRFHEKWSIHAEAQYRDFGIIDEPEQVLLRTGMNFHIAPTAFFTAGYGRITNYKDDGDLFEQPLVSENRVWQQFLIRHQLSRFHFEHRYRLEQRWIESSAGKNYLDRFRYFLRLSVPLNKKQIEPGTFFFSLYDEVFLHFSENPFDRNRFYSAFGYQFNKSLGLQLGYLAQTTNAFTKHHLQTAIFYTIDLR